MKLKIPPPIKCQGKKVSFELVSPDDTGYVLDLLAVRELKIYSFETRKLVGSAYLKKLFDSETAELMIFIEEI